MDLSRQESGNGLPLPPPGELPDPGIEPGSLTSLVLAGGFFATSVTWEAQYIQISVLYSAQLTVKSALLL